MPDKAELCREFPWLSYVMDIASGIVNTLFEKEEHYRGSWQRRGGTGAYMMSCRKSDRVESIVERFHHYDILEALEKNTGEVEDDIKDLIGYYILILAEAKRRRDAILLAEKASYTREVPPQEVTEGVVRLQDGHLYSVEALMKALEVARAQPLPGRTVSAGVFVPITPEDNVLDWKPVEGMDRDGWGNPLDDEEEFKDEGPSMDDLFKLARIQETRPFDDGESTAPFISSDRSFE